MVEALLLGERGRGKSSGEESSVVAISGRVGSGGKDVELDEPPTAMIPPPAPSSTPPPP